VEKSAVSPETPQGLTCLGVKGVNASVVSGDENFAVGDYRFNACPDSLVNEIANPSEAERRSRLRSHKARPLRVAPQGSPIAHAESVEAKDEKH
jgi:hypothetical protein